MNHAKGVVRIEFQIVDGNLQLMLNAPMETDQARALTVQILAQAIPIALNYRPSPIATPGNGIIKPPLAN